jgi:hypothetical protein
MDTQPSFGLKELLTHIISGVAKAVSERPGETQAQQFARSLAATHAILAFRPIDAIEAMLAGHCVMFHEMIVDSVQAALRGKPAAAHGNVVAMDREFGNNLTHLARYRAWQATAQQAPSQNAPSHQAPSHLGHDRAETDIADRINRHQTQTQADPRGPAGTAGPDQPAEALSAMAATPLPVLNRQARRELDRQAGKSGVPPMVKAGVTSIHTAPATTISATASG